MKMKIFKVGSLVAFVLMLTLGWSASAQSHIRYVKPEDFGTKTLYADSVLTSITLPQGVSRLSNYYKFNLAAFELFQVLENPEMELMQVWVCGSASPDGLWGDNVKLSQARTDNAVEYIKSVMNIPDYMIHAESLNEDWDRLAELVQASDLPFKYEVLYIIRTKNWGERKTALQRLDGGNVWKILEKDFFPLLRCVRFAIFCKWDPSKPYLSAPAATVKTMPQPEPTPEPIPVEQPKVVKELPANADTVYVRDTVVIIKETIVKEQTVPAQVVETPYPTAQTKEIVYQEYRKKSLDKEKKLHDTPWLIGLKTNLLADAMVIPMGGLEFQLGKKVSLDLQGWYTNYNVFCKEDDQTNVYGITPEIRWWARGRAMERGSFFGIHARAAWYTLQWRDGYLYQNGKESQYSSTAGNHAPAWSVGLTYGYSFALDRKARWGLEFVLGIGYGNYSQNLGAWSETDKKWYIYEHQNNTHTGITRAGINLTYRFSTRKVNPEYYNRTK